MTSPDVRTWPLHMKAQWGGNLGAPALEQWSNTVKFAAFTDSDPITLADVPTPAQMQIACDAAAPVLAAWISRPTSRIGYAANLTYLKLNMIGTSGRQVDTINTVQHQYPAPASGAHPSPPPWSQTYALTLRTSASRGRAHAGRIFPPMVLAQPDQFSPYITIALADGMAQSFATCLADLATAINSALEGAGFAPSSFGPAVISPGSANRGTQPMLASFTHVVVDRVADVQHRRTDSVPRAEGTAIAI